MILSPIHFTALLLYAETHFRFFCGFPSLLFRKEPEVVFDCPRRLDKGKDLPVMLLVNDIDRFPVLLESVSITVSVKNSSPLFFDFKNPDSAFVKHALSDQSHVYLFTICREKLPSGSIFVNCKAVLSNRKRKFIVLNDNLPGTSKLSFSCFCAEELLPNAKNSSYGDLHIHSQFSQSHVEFGPPVRVIDEMAHANGLDFYAVTDHSYDLACSIDNYLIHDNTTARWKLFANEAATQHFKSIFIRGEEISCTNAKRKTIHLCGINLSAFIPGSADGARKNSSGTLPLPDVIDKIHKQSGLALAAHPGSISGFLQHTFLNRGRWEAKDIAQNIDAVQAVNNGFKSSWHISKDLWINALLYGRKLPIVAGNDSHGDFNRYRFISMPFVSVGENFDRYLGGCRTGLYTKVTCISDVLAEIKRGATFVTNGPFLCLSTSDSVEQNIISNQDIDIAQSQINAIVQSNEEFGMPWLLQILHGKIGDKCESVVFSKQYHENQYIISQTIDFKSILHSGYIRAEITCKNTRGLVTFAATSPCYIL